MIHSSPGTNGYLINDLWCTTESEILTCCCCIEEVAMAGGCCCCQGCITVLDSERVTRGLVVPKSWLGVGDLGQEDILRNFVVSHTGNLYKAVPMLRECCRQGESEEVSNSRN